MFYELSYCVLGSEKPLSCKVELIFNGFKELYNLPDIIGLSIFSLTFQE